VPSTTVYDLPFEHEDDQPLHSLTGGSSGTEPILAEEVETELIRIDADVAAVQDAVAVGWRPIIAGTETGNFTIDLTASGEFPAGTFDLIQVRFRGSLSEESYLQVRVNGDSTADLHRRASWLISSVDGSVIDPHSADGTTWRIAQWSTGVSNTGQIIIYNTDVSSILSCDASGFRASAGTTLRRRTEAHGFLTSARLLSSLTVFPVAGAVTACRWWAQGYRAA
jgi:hypothetical protein